MSSEEATRDELTDTRGAIASMMSQMEQAVLGQGDVIRALTLALLCNGNVLLEGLPGTAKTRSIKTLARVLQASLGRIQFTPDLLPSDVTGNEIYLEKHGKAELTFQPGPLFNELVLADEINRAPAKVQSALLEAMEERQITVAGTTYPMPELFMVLATQNPIEQEGTYPLPEAQMDRFLLKVAVNYPSREAELDVVRLLQGEETAHETAVEPIAQAHVLQARDEIHRMQVSPAVEQYLVDLVVATREPDRYGSDLSRWIETGASPRASIALHRVCRANAWLAGRDHPTPEDVRAAVHPVLRHRFIRTYDALADRVTPDTIIDELLRQVAVG